MQIITDCRHGDGINGSDIYIGNFTQADCITEVKAQKPTANGATTDAFCKNNLCGCWAEFNMTTWSDSYYYQSCLFTEGE